MIRLSAMLVGTLIAITAYAQPDLLWSQTYGGRGSDWCYSVIQTPDDGFALAGLTDSFGAGGVDFWLVVTDKEGEELWSQTYGGDSIEYCYSHILTDDVGYALAGFTNSFGAGEMDFWLVRTDEEGGELWSQTYGGEQDEICQSVIQTVDGGFALAGYTVSIDESDLDFLLVVTDEEGGELWSQTYGGEDWDVCSSIIQTADGGFALAGFTGSFGEGGDFWLVRTDEEGEEIWSQTYGGENNDDCYSIIQTPDGGFALAGRTLSFGEGGDFWLVRTDEEGEEIWSQTCGGEDSDFCESVIQTADGGFTLAGKTVSYDEEGWPTNFWLVRTDEEGEELWSQTCGGEEWDWCYSIIQTADGSFALAGFTESFGEGGMDFWLVRTGPDPVSAPSESFIPHPSSFILLPAYPNPFNSRVQVGYQAPRNGFISLKVYDQAGRSVASLFEGRVQTGKGVFIWDAAGFPAGIYLVRLEAGDVSRTVKMALIR